MGGGGERLGLGRVAWRLHVSRAGGREGWGVGEGGMALQLICMVVAECAATSTSSLHHHYSVAAASTSSPAAVIILIAAGRRRIHSLLGRGQPLAHEHSEQTNRRGLILASVALSNKCGVLWSARPLLADCAQALHQNSFDKLSPLTQTYPLSESSRAPDRLSHS